MFWPAVSTAVEEKIALKGPPTDLSGDGKTYQALITFEIVYRPFCEFFCQDQNLLNQF